MTEEHWIVNVEIARQRQDEDRFYQAFQLEVDPDEYVLDVVERIWAQHDRSLTFRHACHHSTCGACAMIVNGVEKLTCITPVRSVTKNGGKMRVEPLRNFPVMSDLVVDMSGLYQDLEKTHLSQVAALDQTYLPFEKQPAEPDQERLIDCIECGMCISACPGASTSQSYLGPAVMAAAHHAYIEESQACLLDLVDNRDGVWRCHSAYECSEVCPSNVDPGWRIMDLRKRIIQQRVRGWFAKKETRSV